MTRKKLQFTAVALGSLRVMSTCQLEQSHRTSSNANGIIVTIRSLERNVTTAVLHSLRLAKLT